MAPGCAATKQQQPELQTAKRCFQGRIVRKRFGDHGFFQGGCVHASDWLKLWLSHGPRPGGRCLYPCHR